MTSDNLEECTLDEDFSTYWESEGIGEYLEFCLDEARQIECIEIAFFEGNLRTSMFDLEVSLNGASWNTVLSNQAASGSSNAYETFTFSPVFADRIRIIGQGSNLDNINKISEVNWNAECSCIPTHPCDDNNALTTNDVYDLNCNCVGSFHDSDGDGVDDDQDACPNDINKIEPGDCGCGVADEDLNSNGISDCLDAPTSCNQSNFANAPTGLFTVQNGTGTRLYWDHYSNEADGCVIRGGTIGVLDPTVPFNQTPGRVLIQGAAINGLPDGFDFSANLTPNAQFTLFNTSTFPSGVTGNLIPGAFYKWQVQCGCIINPSLPLPERLGASNVVVSPWSPFETFTNLTNTPEVNEEEHIQDFKRIGSDSYELYPNPFNEEIILEFDGETPEKIEIFNAMGQLVYVSTISERKFKIGTEALPKGMYFISLHYSSNVESKKIIKN